MKQPLTHRDDALAIRAKVHEAIKLVDQVHSNSQTLEAHNLTIDIEAHLRKTFALLIKLAETPKTY